MRLLPRRGAVFAVALVVLIALAWAAITRGGDGTVRAGFEEFVVDATGPVDPWGKAVGDLDGDGLPDMVVGGHAPAPPVLWRRLLHKLHLWNYEWPQHGNLVWYSGRDRTRHLISSSHNVRTDIEVIDIDRDGRADVVTVTDQGIVWFRNPDWAATTVDTRALHDVEVADLDGDGKPDMVARNQHLFGHRSADRLHFYRQESPSKWVHAELHIRPDPYLDFGGEGLKVADIDGDGRPDAVINQAWFRNPGDLRDPAAWVPVPYCPAWNWPHANLEVADLNGDGRLDIVMAPAEPARAMFRLSWCEAPSRPGMPWVEHVIDPHVETVIHGVAAADLDGDGRIAVVTASMHLARGSKDIAVYRPAGDGQAWSRSVIGVVGSHSLKLLDVDRDGDLDVFGANFSGDAQGVHLWINRSASRTGQGWRRHVIDDTRPWPSTFVLAADLDGDRRPDLVSGSRWFRNPGPPGGRWSAAAIGKGFNNVALVHDFDGDGRPDLLASTWNGDDDVSSAGRAQGAVPGGLVWARNLGQGRFEVHDNIEPGTGDFLQGVALLRSAQGDRVVLSWHQPGLGLQQLRIPRDPVRERWRTSLLSPTSQDEELSAADIDRDGVPDLVLGTVWLRQEGPDAWARHLIQQPPGDPDRHRVGDVDRDGKLDIVVGHEAVSRPGKLAWYRQGSDPKQPWTEQVIAQLTGPMSVSLVDMDGDGDLDVVVGEHELRHPGSARLMWFENASGDGRRWRRHAIHTGDEHHDGALAVDLDNDGDLDIVSIGWGHGQLIVYENLGRDRS